MSEEQPVEAARAEDPSALLRLLLARLEKISADSVWAHRASGARGSLLRAWERIEGGETVPPSELSPLMELGFYILRKAAEEKAR